jgi:hypothetical protein
MARARPQDRSEVVAGLLAALDVVADEARCLLLTGSGTTFCAGFDLKRLGRPPDPDEADALIAPQRVEVPSPPPRSGRRPPDSASCTRRVGWNAFPESFRSASPPISF